MLHTVIKKNLYQDSVSLMLLTNHLSAMDNVERISVMMGTPSNKDIMKGSGLYTDELEEASPNDLVVVAETEDMDSVVEELANFLENQTADSEATAYSTVRTWEMAGNKLPNADLAVISIAGEHAAIEANKALDRDLNVFLFSDNVSIEDELQLKQKASDKGLIVMGPDCGTGILNEVPIAFANVVEKGNIGVVGASGTGIQEVTTIIARNGGGVSQAIGTGGRDLSSEIGAITTIKALKVLDADPNTDVITYISKPPAPEVRDKVIEVFKTLSKPVVAVFIGNKPQESHDNVHYAWTLEDTAVKSLELAQNSNLAAERIIAENEDIQKIKANGEQRYIKGYYCGGTLALEAAMILEDAFNLDPDAEHPEGMMLHHEGHEVIDLGDDAYTQGRAHPMIDPTFRVEKVKEAAQSHETAIILLDNVIGYGAHEDMAGVFAPVIETAKQEAAEEGRAFIAIASVTGTAQDPQVYQDQVDKLEAAGVIVTESNAQATKLAGEVIAYLNGKEIADSAPATETNSDLAKISELISDKPSVINVGLSGFADTVQENGGQVVQYQWAPIAGGDKRLAKILDELSKL